MVLTKGSTIQVKLGEGELIPYPMHIHLPTGHLLNPGEHLMHASAAEVARQLCKLLDKPAPLHGGWQQQQQRKRQQEKRQQEQQGGAAAAAAAGGGSRNSSSSSSSSSSNSNRNKSRSSKSNNATGL